MLKGKPDVIRKKIQGTEPRQWQLQFVTKASKVNSNINVTPMVDVMLVLLIIFMVITPMLQNKVPGRHGQGG